jgi:hypothetical protein
MAITISTSDGPMGLKEAYGGYEAGIDVSRGPYIRKRYLAPSWNAAFAVVNALMGIGGRPVPHRCPESLNLRCLNARLVPEAEVDARDGGHPRFNLPVIEADYGVLPWDAEPQDDPGGQQGFDNDGQPFVFMEQSIDFDTEIIKLPNTTYIYTSTGKPVDVPCHVSVGTAEFVLVRHWQSTFPVLNVTGYLNRVNDARFLGQAEGTIKFRKARTRRSWTSDGTTTQEVEYRFQWREISHNMFPRPDSRNFDTIQDGSGNSPYRTAALSDLLL